MTNLKTLIAMSCLLSNTFSLNTEEWKSRILKRWEESKLFPRKKKKAVRKGLQLDWSLACYDPFKNF